MIKVEPILDILETGLWTGKLAKEKPLSILLIASVGDGKSEALRKAYTPPNIRTEWAKGKDGGVTGEKIQIVTQVGTVLYTTDTTPYILHNKYGDILKSGQVKHIVIPDFLSILTKGKDAMPDTIRFYNALIEEGICRIESKKSDFVVTVPVQIGLITAVSSQDYVDRSQQQKWGNFGFISRILPVSYRYTEESKVQIRRSAYLREYHNEQPFELNFPAEQVYVELPPKYLHKVDRLANDLKDTTDDAGARRMKQLTTFVMGYTLKKGRDIVSDEDIEALLYYAKFFNAKCTVEL